MPELFNNLRLDAWYKLLIYIGGVALFFSDRGRLSAPSQKIENLRVGSSIRYRISFRLVMQRSPRQGEGIGKSGHGIADPRFVDTALTRARYARLPSPWSGRGVANVGA